MSEIDPLSNVLSLLELQGARCTRLEAGGRWALRFPARSFLKFVAMLRGSCWIHLDGEAPCQLMQGDTFLLADAPPYVIASDLGQPAEDGNVLFGGAGGDRVRYGGDETVMLGGSFVFGDENAPLLLNALPSFVRLSADDPAAPVLRNTLQVLDAELEHTQMGSALMVRRVADALLVQALRSYVAINDGAGASWIGALGDRRMGTVLKLMHGPLDKHWTVAELANAVGMSRSAFALRFKTLVGRAPLDYLLHWRMQYARSALRRDDVLLASLATQLGYASESAFGNAFKRVFGRSPRRYWR